MDATQFARVKTIVIGAQHRHGQERLAYLDEACGADALLRAEVESLLSHADTPLPRVVRPVERRG